jgi:hypothetical protein
MKRNGYDIGHTSILHGISVAAERAKSDKDYKKVVKSLDK